MEAGDARRNGAHPDGGGTSFTVTSRVAYGVELCLFTPGGDEHRVELPRVGDDTFSGYVPGVGAGARYGFRVHGPWEPAAGLRCNPAKLLLDPYGRRFEGRVDTHPAIYGHDLEDPALPSDLDSAPHVLRSVVADPSFDWGADRHPRVPLADTVVYETHVRGISRLHPDVPDHLRGTYAGLAHPAVVAHLLELGVTTVELLPVHQFVHEPHLLAAHRTNYWGYNSIGFFAPHYEYAAGPDPVTEFKETVRALHAAGLEVLLDVVYNHTAEGNHLGPTLSFRGLDNPRYYRLDPADPTFYLNWTGTGNTVDLSEEEALRLVLDSLRYWVADMHVDGFRFDLATTLGRTYEHFDPLGGFFGAVAQDPVLRGTKLIAEPWDVGPDGYRVGGFGRRWAEWNDTYRDTLRDFWRGREGMLGRFANKITGSADIYDRGRPPTATVNFVTSHDGFTLHDLVSYEERRNEANGEENRDGHGDNRSWNSGAEGRTTDPAVLTLRRRRQRSFLATLLLSQGVPMISGGDELGRTQDGNNNAYNQDNELSWYDWKNADGALLEFTARLVALRRRHPTFRRGSWLHEHPDPGIDRVGWFSPRGEEMTPADWENPTNRAVALYLDGDVVHGSEGTVADDDFLLFFNGSAEPASFVIPTAVGNTRRWTVAIDTAESGRRTVTGRKVEVDAFAVVVLARRPLNKLTTVR